MRFVDRPDNAALDKLDYLAVVLCGVDLDTHLGCDLGFRCGFANAPSLPDIVGERLLAIDVFAVLESEHSGESVRVFAGANYYGIKISGMIKKFPEIRLFPSLGMFRGCGVQ